jgi:hypothetical protein
MEDKDVPLSQTLKKLGKISRFHIYDHFYSGLLPGPNPASSLSLVIPNMHYAQLQLAASIGDI